MAVKKAAFIYSEEFEKYPYPQDSPFNTTRAGKVFQLVKSMGLLSGPDARLVDCTAADRLTLKKFHTAF